jgi:hypothetical protein
MVSRGGFEPPTRGFSETLLVENGVGFQRIHHGEKKLHTKCINQIELRQSILQSNPLNYPALILSVSTWCKSYCGTHFLIC